jgi:predicted alpha/beta superfamily hydrolase
MKNVKKKVIGASLGAVFALASISPVFAADISTAAATQATTQQKVQHLDKIKDRSSKLKIDTSNMTTAKQIKQAIHKQVKEKHQAKKQKRVERLNKLAAKLHIDTTGKTPQQIKQAIHTATKAKREAKLQKIAQKKGITVEQLKAQQQAKHQAKQAQQSTTNTTQN